MNIIYCMECAQRLSKLSDSEYTCPNGHTFWNEPKACVAVIMYKEKSEVLFSKRAKEPFKGQYDLPGGFCEFNEDPLVAAKREVTEETGMTIHGLEVIAAYTGMYSPVESVCDIVVLAREHTGTPQPNDDSDALEWHPLEFIDDPAFNPDYPGLRDKLRTLIANK